MAATAAAAKLGPPHGDDLDACLSEQRIGVSVAVVGHDNAGLQRDDVVAIIPLLALGLVDVAPGRMRSLDREPEPLMIRG